MRARIHPSVPKQTDARSIVAAPAPRPAAWRLRDTLGREDSRVFRACRPAIVTSMHSRCDLGAGSMVHPTAPPKPSVRRRLLWVYLPCSAPGASVNNPAPDMPAASAPPPPSSLTLDQRSGCAAAMGARTGNQLAKHSSGARDADRADPRHPVPKLVGIGGGVCRRFLRRRVVRYGRRTGVVGVATYVVHGSDACVVKGRRQPGSQRASSRAPARRAAQIPRIDKGGRVVAGASRQGKRRRRDRVAAMVRRTRSVP